MLDFNKKYLMIMIQTILHSKKPEYLHIGIASEEDNSEDSCSYNEINFI